MNVCLFGARLLGLEFGHFVLQNTEYILIISIGFLVNINHLISSLDSWNQLNSFSWDLFFCRNLGVGEADDFMSLLAIVENAPLSKVDSEG